MFAAPSKALIWLVQVAFTVPAETSAFQGSSGVNSGHPDDPMNWPPVPVPVVPAVPVKLPVPAVPIGPALPPLHPPPHPTTVIATVSNKIRMRGFYTFGDASIEPSSRRRRTSGE